MEIQQYSIHFAARGISFHKPEDSGFCFDKAVEEERYWCRASEVRTLCANHDAAIEALQAENARLKEPVSDEECIKHRVIPTFDNPAGTMYKHEINALIASRAIAPVSAEPVDSSGKTQCSATMGSRRCSSAIGHNGVHFYQSDEMRYFTGGPGVWRPAGTEVGEPDQ